MQTNVVMQAKHVREEVPLLHYTDLLSRYTLCNVHNWASCTAMTTSPHSWTPTRPRLDFWKSDLIVRLSEIFLCPRAWAVSSQAFGAVYVTGSPAP